MKHMLLCVLVLILVISVTVSAQQNQNLESSPLGLNYPINRDFLGDGARALGMGGAYIAVSDDVSGVSWNPAGVYDRASTFEQPILSISYGRFSPTSKYVLGGEVNQIGSISQNQIEGSNVLGGIEMVGLATPIRIKNHPFVFVGQFSRLADEYFASGANTDTSLFWSPDDQSNGILGRQTVTQRTVNQTRVNALNLGFGTRLYDRISLGLAVNIYSGSTERNAFSDIYQQNLPVVDFQRADFRTLLLQTDSISYSGVYLTLGLKYKGDKFSSGLIIKTPHTLSMDIDIAYDTTVWRNGFIDPNLSGQINFDDNNLVELDQPLTLGLGLAYDVTPKLLVAADFEYRAFSGGKVRVRESIELVPGAADKEFFSTSDPKWKNVLAMRFGSEYRWETGSSKVPLVPIRVGFARSPSPTPEYNQTSTSTYSTSAVSFGSGVHWEQIHLDLAYTHTSFELKNWGPIGAYMISETSTNTYNKLKFTFTGYF